MKNSLAMWFTTSSEKSNFYLPFSTHLKQTTNKTLLLLLSSMKVALHISSHLAHNYVQQSRIITHGPFNRDCHLQLLGAHVILFIRHRFVLQCLSYLYIVSHLSCPLFSLCTCITLSYRLISRAVLFHFKDDCPVSSDEQDSHDSQGNG